MADLNSAVRLRGNASLMCDSKKSHTHGNSRVHDVHWVQTGAGIVQHMDLQLRVTEFDSSRHVTYRMASIVKVDLDRKFSVSVLIGLG